MGQQEVLDFLMRYPTQWYSTQQIGFRIGIGDVSVNRCLRLLRQSRDVICQYDKKPKKYRYRQEDGQDEQYDIKMEVFK